MGGREKVHVIYGALGGSDIEALTKECDLFARLNNVLPDDNDRVQVDMATLGCSIDLFEHASIPDRHPARHRREEYFKARWGALSEQSLPGQNSLGASARCFIRDVILSKLPSYVQGVLEDEGRKESMAPKANREDKDALYLFNEHYVVKYPGSRIAFRWHRDMDEQLGGLASAAQAPSYHSVWCPLVDVDELNGTLVVAGGTDIITYTVKDGVPQKDDNVKFRYKRKHSQFSADDDDDDDDDGGEVEGHPEGHAEALDASRVALSLPAGSAVIFSSTLWHRSGANRSSDTVRRVYYAQYSSSVIGIPRVPGELQGVGLDGVAGAAQPRGGGKEEGEGEGNEGQRLGDVEPLAFAIRCLSPAAKLDNNQEKQS
jgi:hypothetical protein